MCKRLLNASSCCGYVRKYYFKYILTEQSKQLIVSCWKEGFSLFFFCLSYEFITLLKCLVFGFSQQRTKAACVTEQHNNMEGGSDSIIEDICYPDPGIKIRDVNKLTFNDGGVNQIWALSDKIDHMPISYAKVKQVGQSNCLHMLKYQPLTQ